MKTRDAMAGWLGYMMKKQVVKVILSTMTDMADLLGSYEQVGDQSDVSVEDGNREQYYEVVCR
jgi:hypothetical protein